MQSRILATGILYGFIFLLFSIPSVLRAQQTQTDTLHLNVSQAEDIFLQKNLTLLANQYNIDISKALVQQARVWDNPVLNTDQTLYDGKFFHHKTVNGQPYGEVYIQVQQLIRTAGKIKKQTQLAQDNLLGAEAQFNEVMRNLKFVLTNDLNNLAQLQNIASVYQKEMQTMQLLVKGMDEMLKTGNISQRENIRIKALMFSLQSDYNDNLQQQYDLQKELSTLLQLKDHVWLVADSGQPFSTQQMNELSITALLDSALQNRPDLAFVKSQSVFQQHNISYQKALAKPDINIGAEYDKLNSYVPNYYGLAVSIPLPLFNRNKGNISAAELSYKQSGVVVDQVQSQVNREVMNAWQKMRNATSMLTSDNNQLQANYDLLMNNMISSYQQRQVGLIEFIDFFDAYKETRIKQWQLITNQRNAAAELNYTINQNLFKL